MQHMLNRPPLNASVFTEKNAAPAPPPESSPSRWQFLGIGLFILSFVFFVAMLCVGAKGYEQHQSSTKHMPMSDETWTVPVTDEPGKTLGKSGSLALLIVGAVFTFIHAVVVLILYDIAKNNRR